MSSSFARCAVLTVTGCLSLTLLSTTACAQSALGTRAADYGGFVGLDLRFGDMGAEFAAFAGAEAAVLLKQRAYIGVRGGGLTTDNSSLPSTGSSPGGTLAMGYGGLLVGYIVPTRSMVDFSVDALFGGGGVGTTDSDREKDWDGIFVFEPSATVDLRLAPMARIGLGVAYRFVGDVDLVGLRDSDFRGLTGLLRVRLGKF
jgi:hypothetical protein